MMAQSIVQRENRLCNTWEKSRFLLHRVMSVNPAYTSHRCSGCGSIERKTLDERTHRCTVGDFVLDRDTNASVNIMSLGQQRLVAVYAR